MTALATGFARNFRRRRYTVVQWTPSKFAANTASFFERSPRPNGLRTSAAFAARISASSETVNAAPFSSLVRRVSGIKGQHEHVSKINGHPNVQTLLKHNAPKCARSRRYALFRAVKVNSYSSVIYGHD
jgi:hypothetical protein